MMLRSHCYSIEGVRSSGFIPPAVKAYMVELAPEALPSVSLKERRTVNGLRGLRPVIVGPLLPRRGGVSVQTEILCRYLEEEGAEPIRVNTDVSLARRAPLIGRWVLVLVQPFVWLWRLRKAVPNDGIVHVQAASYWGLMPLAPALLVGRGRGARIVVSYFGGRAEDFLRRWGWVARPLLRAADVVSTSSAYLAGVFARHGIPMRVVPSIIEIERYPEVQRDRFTPDLLWVRQFTPTYNPAMLMRVFQRVQSVCPQASLRVIGSGPLEAEVMALVDELGVENVEFRGRVSFAGLQTAYRQASVFLNTAAFDNFPLTLLEAGANSLPVVSTNVGGIQELVEDGKTGFLVDPDDDAAMAERVLWLIQHPDEALAMGRAARCKAEAYGWPAIREQIQSLYLVRLDERPHASI